MHIKLMYKIHGLSTAQGECRSAGNAKFYETRDEALGAARSHCARGNDSMVIYKAHILVRPQHPPVEVLSIANNGDVVPL